MVSIKRKAIEQLYVGLCTVKVYVDVKDPISKITSKKEVIHLDNQPCRLSIEKQTSATATVGPATIAQTTKVFIAPELTIPSGSKVIVAQHGKITEYARSGVPAVYSDHQEIMLELFKGYV